MHEFSFEDERLVSIPDLPANESPRRWVEPTLEPEAGDEDLELDEEPGAHGRTCRPWALLLDAGDLADVHRILARADTPLVRLSDASPTPECWPQRLLVVSGARALTMERRPVDPEDRVVTVAILSEASRTLVRRVRGLGFDYVIERPVNTDALRHLLLEALYRSGERRAEKRFAVGWKVRFRSGWRTREAELTELSRWGCSLHVKDAPDPGARIKLSLPPELTQAGSLVLPAYVCRSERRGDAERSAQITVLFEKDAQTRARLGPVLARVVHGPPKLDS